MFSYFCKEASFALQNLNTFRTFGSDDALVVEAKSRLYDATVAFTSYEVVPPQQRTVAIAIGLVNVLSQEADIISQDEFDT
jgi:hypothetical protein